MRGSLARKGAVMIKVAKPNQDMRFDVPVIGVETIRVAAEAKSREIAIEARKTLLLEQNAIVDLPIAQTLRSWLGNRA